MTASNIVNSIPKFNADAFKNNRKLILYLVMFLSFVSVTLLIVLIIWLATKDNVSQPITPSITGTPEPTVQVGPTIIPDIPVIESTKFVYIEMPIGKTSGNIVSYDLNNNIKETISSAGNIKKLISISPNNKYLFVQTVNNSGKEDFGIFSLETGAYDLIKITSYIQSFWSSNEFLNILYSGSINYKYSIDSYNVREKTQTEVLTFTKDLINGPFVSRDLNYLVGIDDKDDSFHFIDLSLKTNQLIEKLNLISGSYFVPLVWNKENRLIYSSNSGIYKFNPILLNSTQLISLTTRKDKLEIQFPNYNEDQKSMLFMLDGYIYRFSINTEILKEVLNVNNRSNLKLVDLQGNGQNFFLMENYDGMLEAYNIKNTKLATICELSCKNPIWLY